MSTKHILIQIDRTKSRLTNNHSKIIQLMNMNSNKYFKS